jgi:polyhydroxybutyrate depolymerase
LNSRINFYFIVSLFLFVSCLRNRHDDPADTLYDIGSSLVHNGKTRTYLVHLPTMYYELSSLRPLILAFHGGLGSKENFRDQSGLNAKSDAEKFIVVYPDGLENPGALNARTWNAGKCCGQNALSLNTDDVGFVSQLIDELAKTYHVDKKRVYATGHSNGAMLCYRLANELSEKITAIAPNAGNFQIRTAYAPVRNVPVLDIQSKLDENVYYNGGVSTGPAHQLNPPLDSCLNVVAARASCQVAKEAKESHPLYTIYSWDTCDPASFKVLLYLTEDGGHSWPGGNKGHADADEPSKAFNNNDIIWDFFKDYALP